MKEDKSPVFIFNCHFNGLALIQELGRLGIPVYALDTHRSIGTRSKYAKYIKVTDPLVSPEQFIHELIQLAKNFKSKPLLLPTNDHWSEAISKYKNRLSEYCIVSASHIDTTELLLDKERFAKWCLKKYYPVPTVYNIESIVNNETIIKYPVALKANSRRRLGADHNNKWSKAADELRFKICQNIDQIKHYYEIAETNDVPIYLQQLVNGRSDSMRTIGVFANKGAVRGIIYGRKVRGFPAQHGDCVVGEALPVPTWAKDLAISICKDLEYTGIAEIELMQDSVSKEHFIIEINPRSWSWVGVGPAAGVSLAWLAYKELILGEYSDTIDLSCQDNESVVFTKVFEDLLNSLIFYRLDEANDWSSNPVAWYSKYTNKKVVYAGLSPDDPNVALHTAIHGIKHAISGLKTLKLPFTINSRK